jgi:uncharacterized membrane protein (DUF485 family)
MVCAFISGFCWVVTINDLNNIFNGHSLCAWAATIGWTITAASTVAHIVLIRIYRRLVNEYFDDTETEKG